MARGIAMRRNGMATEQRETTGSEKVIAFVLYPGLTPLDLIGPLQVLGALPAPFKSVVIGLDGEAVPTDVPIFLAPAATYADVPHPHALVIPGGSAGTIAALAGGATLDYIREAATGAVVVASVCTGALLLAGAGLLAGRRATTHWAAADLLERLGVTYVPERWVEDGKVVTAAGVSAGIDMALYLAAKLSGETTAKMIQAAIEYDPSPPFGGIDRSVLAPLRGLYQGGAWWQEALATIEARRGEAVADH
jgi:transcriptional regulator GlxA family with amidase domain